MCRWLAYKGSPIMMSDLLIKPKHNLIEQSLHAKAPRTPTNGDGFGLGWYTNKHPQPGLFRSIRPAWNDTNLIDLASHIESTLFMAHVRATSMATIQETNCHPFRYKNWLFMHNGQIASFNLVHRELLLQIAPEYFHNINGTTDSEIMFHLALTYGLETNVEKAIAKTVQVVEKAGKEKGVDPSLWMTLAISDGTKIWGYRYGSDRKGPSLYLSPTIEDLARLNPALREKFDENSTCLVSEPIGDYSDIWKEVPEQSKVLMDDSGVLISSFKP